MTKRLSEETEVLKVDVIEELYAVDAMVKTVRLSLTDLFSPTVNLIWHLI